jgi:CRISPR system Cascade subunit CasD
MSEPYLLLWLEAPLQSWGHDSRFGRRDSLDFPTKSGVLGLLCCAEGRAGPQEEWLAAWADLDMRVMAFVPADEQGEACRRLPMARDFQMVGSGYDAQNPWESLLIPKTSEGKKAVGGGSKMTYRYYLQDMAFAVAIQGPKNLVDSAAEKLTAPVWDLYLGRKSCAPTEFIFQGIHPTPSAAFEFADQISEEKNKRRSFSVLQGKHEGEVISLNDVPLRFGDSKKYRDRRVTVISEVQTGV